MRFNQRFKPRVHYIYYFNVQASFLPDNVQVQFILTLKRAALLENFLCTSSPASALRIRSLTLTTHLSLNHPPSKKNRCSTICKNSSRGHVLLLPCPVRARPSGFVLHVFIQEKKVRSPDSRRFHLFPFILARSAKSEGVLRGGTDTGCRRLLATQTALRCAIRT